MGKRETRDWPSAEDDGKRVVARTHSGERVEGCMRATGVRPGETKEVQLFALVLDDGERIDWSGLKGWRFVDADNDERPLAKWGLPFIGAWMPLDLVPLLGV